MDGTLMLFPFFSITRYCKIKAGNKSAQQIGDIENEY
jgi:hypothetical protein